LQPAPLSSELWQLPKRRLKRLLQLTLEADNLDLLRSKLSDLEGLRPQLGWGQEEATVEVRPDLWQAQLSQIRESRSLERARHYVKRLIKSFEEVKTPSFSDINLHRWQEYQDLWTDSLWQIDKRDRQGQHSAHYWGNFVPQIPHQLMRRFSKKGEWIIDPFLGSGTTLIEARRLGRNALGVELQAKVAANSQERINNEANPHQVSSLVCVGDSQQFDF